MPPAIPAKIEPRAFSINEACKYLRVGRVTLYRLIARGHVRSFTIGKSRRVTRDALDEYIARREREAG